MTPLDTPIPQLSETGKMKMTEFNNFGWLIWFANHWDSKIKIKVWKLLRNIASYEMLKGHTSVLETAFTASLEQKELYGVWISALNFLEKSCEILIQNETFDAENSCKD